MKITERLSERGASEAEIQYLEALVDAKLPDEYRQFLVEVNGGRPSPREFEGPTGDGSVVHLFFTLDRSAQDYWIPAEIEAYTDRIPRQTLPIAGDPFGNLILLDLGAKSVGAIYFWDHENENPDGDAWWDNISYIAPSFTDFVEHLH